MLPDERRPRQRAVDVRGKSSVRSRLRTARSVHGGALRLHTRDVPRESRHARWILATLARLRLDSKRGMRAHFVALEKDVERELALANRLVDVEVCAVSEVWSGSKLVIPMKDRSGKR